MTVRGVQGAYMLGEETVLLKALEGRRGQPEQRPPYPSERGLWGRPTLVHNVVTLAAVPWIVVHGADAYRAIGDQDAPGTILVQVSGAVTTPGIAEVPTGTSLEAIVALAGGVADGRPLKAILVGGPSGGLLPPELARHAIRLRAAPGRRRPRRVRLDRRRRRPDLHRGPGAPADPLLRRRGLRQDDPLPDRPASRVRDRRADGGWPARPTDRQLLADLAADIAGSALCDHERLATIPLATAMRYFGPEIDDHLLRGVCPAGVCTPIGVAGAGIANGG